MIQLAKQLASHSFCRDLEEPQIARLAECASVVSFEPDTHVLRDGDAADRCYLLTCGRVALEIRTPSQGDLVIQTIGADEVLGWSWLMPPYRWHLDAHTLEKTEAIVLDGVRLRQICAADTQLGYALLRRVSGLLMQRLTATRLQLIDLYGKFE